jgi:membrane-associated phospholipid phosphatase
MALVEQVRTTGPLVDLDHWMADWVNDTLPDNGLWVQAWRLISLAGWPPLLTVLVAVAAGYMWRRSLHRLTVYLAVTVGGGALIQWLVKRWMDRDRPASPHLTTALGQSFPSGHAFTATVVYGALVLVFMPAVAPRNRHRVVMATAALVVAIALSRIALGVHYLTDVVAGVVLAVAWLALSIAAFNMWRHDQGRRSVDATQEGLEPEAAQELEYR